MKKMNLPNRLTVIRICMVPIILLVGMLTPQNDGSLLFYISSAVCAFLFIAAAVTDMLDGKIARRDKLVTDFGKFLDPVADKFMVIGTLFIILYKFVDFSENRWMSYALIITLILVVFRELAVTAMRMVVASKNVVTSADMIGKVKTVTQIVAISTILLEPCLQYVIRLVAQAINGTEYSWRTDIIPLSWATLALAVVMTVLSGIHYVKEYWKYLDPQK